jgi:PEGA domain/Collagen triple helix repeat (20 copies)
MPGNSAATVKFAANTIGGGIMRLLSIRLALLSVAICAFGVPVVAQNGGGSLQVTSYPSGARVSIDGIDTGKITPMSASLTLGEHTVVVTVSNSGWNPDTRTVNIVSGNNDLSVTLLPTLTIGPQGPAGPTGPQGPTGPAGPAGPSGPAGPQGVKGVNGDDGAAGPKGDKGDSGPIGPPGPAGAPGQNGANVALAAAPLYTCPTGGIAVTDFSGHTEFVCDGPTGPTGPTGPDGPTGPQGPAGIFGRERILESSVPQTIIPGGRMTAGANCPKGKVVLGGGGFTNNPNFVMVTSLFQGDNAWWATFQNQATTDQTVIVTGVAICAVVSP